MQDYLNPETEARTKLGHIGRTLLYEKTANGEIPSVKLGRRRLWPQSGIDAYIERLKAESKQSA